MSLRLLASGSNAKGQLATGTMEDAHVFTPCVFAGCSPGTLPAGSREVLKISGGANHTLVLLSRDCETVYDELPADVIEAPLASHTELWGCGDNRRGQLGTRRSESDPTVMQRLDLPLQSVGLDPLRYAVRDMATGWETSFVVLGCSGESDVLLAMGGNDFGDLGAGAAVSSDSGKGKGKSKDTAQLDGDCHLVRFDHFFASDTRDRKAGPSTVRVQSLAAGPHHAIVSLESVAAVGASRNIVVGWGAARHGQLGPIVDVVTGRPSAIVPPIHVRPFSSSGDPIVDLAVGNQHSVALHRSGRVTAIGSDKKGQTRGLDGVTDATRVGSTWHGTYVASGMRQDQAQIIARGSNSHGQLGVPPPPGDDQQHKRDQPENIVQFPELGLSLRPARPSRLACGSEHVLALWATGGEGGSHGAEVWGWGWNEHGNLGVGATHDVTRPVKIWPSHAQEVAGAGEGEGRAVEGVWAGCGTSFIVVA